MWKVVPLCDNQLRDVNSEDILDGGLYRKCNVYKGGGGYDMFPFIAEKRFGVKLHNQFVVQLYGCSFSCPYCYVTRGGIWGNYTEVSTKELIDAFKRSGQEIFHLMGGAPALYMRDWVELLNELDSSVVFHSDFLLLEYLYSEDVLRQITKKNTLYAVSIKGCDEAEYIKNAGTCLNFDFLFKNLELLCKSGVNFYMTFTGMPEESVEKFKARLKVELPDLYEKILLDSFSINLISYKATCKD